MVAIPRQILFALGLFLGEYVELAQQDDGSFRLAKWDTGDNVSRISPGIIPSRPGPVQP